MAFDYAGEPGWVERSGDWEWSPEPPDKDVSHPLHSYFRFRRLIALAARRGSRLGRSECAHSQVVLEWRSARKRYHISCLIGGQMYRASGATLDDLVAEIRGLAVAGSPDIAWAVGAEARYEVAPLLIDPIRNPASVW